VARELLSPPVGSSGLDGVASSRHLPLMRTNCLLITNKLTDPKTGNDPEERSTTSRKSGG
jgi:hypothetical protein